MRPSTAYVSQATGRRTVLKPRWARLWTYSLVMGGLPQPVSQVVVFSSVLPMLMPGVISGTAVQASSSVIFSRAGGVAPGDGEGVRRIERRRPETAQRRKRRQGVRPG